MASAGDGERRRPRAVEGADIALGGAQEVAEGRQATGRECVAFLAFKGQYPPMTPSDLLTTQEAARLLRCSRQHVVDLCNAGTLRCVRIGVHRRIRRADLDPLLPAPELRREELRSLWLHRAVAGKVVVDPAGAMARARANIERLRSLQPRAATWLDEWTTVLDRGPDAVLEVLSSPSREAVDLRQNTPFAGLLGDEERAAVLAAFAAAHPVAGLAAG